MSPLTVQSTQHNRSPLNSNAAVLARYPRTCAHIICKSLGYATPIVAASILKAVIERKPHHCEWISACYGGDASQAVTNAIQTRRYHLGYMADYSYALTLVKQAIKTGCEPEFASWF